MEQVEPLHDHRDSGVVASPSCRGAINTKKVLKNNTQVHVTYVHPYARAAAAVLACSFQPPVLSQVERASQKHEEFLAREKERGKGDPADRPTDITKYLRFVLCQSGKSALL